MEIDEARESTADGEVGVNESWRRWVKICSLSLPFSLAPFFWQVPEWKAFGVGAAGWYVALLLRAPFALFAKHVLKLDDKKLGLFTVLLSGPCEEACRVLAVILLQSNTGFVRLYSIGLGWAAIEVVFTMLVSFLTLRLLQDQSEKGIEARAALESSMGGRKLEEQSPAWGWLERISANMTHISFTLVLQYGLWIAAPAAVLHSLLNLSVSTLAKLRMLPLAECLFLAVSSAAYVTLVILLHDES